MFSGIVETIGIILDIQFFTDCIHFIIEPSIPFDDLAIGDSVSVNGVCLTVTHLAENSFSVTAVPQTLRITTLNQLEKSSIVNLERSLKVNARLGGHYVQGHIDTTTHILDLKKDGDLALLATIHLPQEINQYVVKKGYITIDGMSITIVDVTPHSFIVTFIPQTQQATIVKQYQIGTKINIEVDIISKYVEKLLQGEHS